jgi:hypothetical protein
MKNSPSWIRTSLGLLALSGGYWASTIASHAQSDEAATLPRFEIQNELGVKTTLAVKKIWVEDDKIDHALDCQAYRPRSWRLPIEIADGVFMSLPLETVQRVTREDEEHIVQISPAGKVVRGKLSGVLCSEDGREYDLDKLSSLIVLRVPKTDREQSPEKSPITWHLRMSDGEKHGWAIRHPSFSYSRYSPSSFPGGSGSWYENSSQSFILKVGDSEHRANLADFVRLSCSSLPPGGMASIGRQVAITRDTDNMAELTVESASGVKTEGRLVLGGRYEQKQPVIGADLVEFADARIAITARNWVLTRETK